MDNYINDIYRYVINTDCKVLILYGGRDTGKSFFVGGQLIPVWMNNLDYFRGVCVRETYNSLKDSCFSEVIDGIDIMGVSNYFKAIKSPLEISHNNGNKLLFRGLDNPTKVKSLKGLSHIWVEEGENLTYRQFIDLLVLLRGGDKQKLIITLNPVNEDQFINEMFVLSQADIVHERFEDDSKKVWEYHFKEMIDDKEIVTKCLCMRTTYIDNYFISDQRKAAIESLKDTDEYLYNVYAKGLFGNRQGKILTKYIVQDISLNIQDYDVVYGGVDFGYNHAFAMLLIGFKDGNIYIIDEVYERYKTTDEVLEIADYKNYPKGIVYYCDSAEPDRIKEMQQHNYNARGVSKEKSSIRHQIEFLQSRKIFISPRCANTMKEIRKWCWRQDKNGKYMDEPVAIEDDAMAALRYSIEEQRKGAIIYGI